MNHCFEDYQSIHKGKRAWIIGSGPSLNQTNLDLIKNELSFGMNCVSLLYNTTFWRPTYFVFCSTYANSAKRGKRYVKSIRETIELNETTSFIWDVFKPAIIQPGALTKNPCWFESMTEYGPDNDKSFSTDASIYLDKSGTTMNVAFQIAYFMGFQEIILLGADLGWKSTTTETRKDLNHFVSSYITDIKNGEWENAHTRRTHQLVKRHLDKLGVKVYNASKKTLLDVYPLVNYEDVLNGKININVRQDEWKEIAEYWKTNNYQGIKEELR